MNLYEKNYTPILKKGESMAGIKGKSGGKRSGSGAKKLPNELKRDNIIKFMINDS